MNTTPRLLAHGYWLLTSVLFVATITMVVVYTPVESTMGPVQKIFYLHLPVAINTFAASFVVFIASIGYLWQRDLWWDDLAAAAGKVTVLFCAVVLLTGMIWGRSAWNIWWTWSPRLTFSLILFLLYVVYLMIRPSIDSPQRRAIVCAVYGIAAFLDVPLVYLSVKLMPDIHPSSIALQTEMKLTLAAWFIPVTFLMAGLITGRFRLNRRLRALDERDRIDLSHPAAVGRIGETA
ncbi:MAG: cytochrome c biogenesis protein [Planctomycetota bacterium]|jgi:heme exporter protein C